MAECNQGAQEQRTVFEVQRERSHGSGGASRNPVVEEFGGLDRARLAALANALDGPTYSGNSFTGRILVIGRRFLGNREVESTLIDDLDERVAFRVLNGLRLPRSGDMAVSKKRLQTELDGLAAMGL